VPREDAVSADKSNAIPPKKEKEGGEGEILPLKSVAK